MSKAVIVYISAEVWASVLDTGVSWSFTDLAGFPCASGLLCCS